MARTRAALLKQAARIAQRYPVTIEYVAGLLDEFSEEHTVIMLDYYASVGRFPSVEELLRGMAKGLGRRRSDGK